MRATWHIHLSIVQIFQMKKMRNNFYCVWWSFQFPPVSLKITNICSRMQNINYWNCDQYNKKELRFHWTMDGKRENKWHLKFSLFLYSSFVVNEIMKVRCRCRVRVSARTFNDFSRLSLFFVFLHTCMTSSPSRLRKLRAASRSHRSLLLNLNGWEKRRSKKHARGASEREARNDYCRNRQFTASLITIHQFSPMIFWLCSLTANRNSHTSPTWQLDLPIRSSENRLK